MTEDKTFPLEGKKKISPENFYKQPYSPKVIHYAPMKVGYGLWNFNLIVDKKEKKMLAVFVGIYRNGFVDFLTHFGFYKKYRKDGSHFFLRCIDNMMEEVEPTVIADFVYDYLQNNGQDIASTENISGVKVLLVASQALQLETIRKQCQSLFSRKSLEMLANFNQEILRDTSAVSYKLFSNKVYRISKEGISTVDYSDLDRTVWKKHIIDFELIYADNFRDCHYYRFIRNISDADNNEPWFHATISAIGYLLHYFNSPEKGQAVLLYDQVIIDIDNPQGGTGKGVFTKALGELSELVIIDGKKFDERERFSFQRISDSTQIVCFDDVKKKFQFDRLNSLMTDGWSVERKNKDEFAIAPADCPKIALASNIILDCEGTTRKRRQFVLEFSDFYSRHIKNGTEKPIESFHGCIFFSEDWDDNEWQRFYSFLLHCIHFYFQHGLVYQEPQNMITNRLRQITCDEFCEWISAHGIQTNKKYETKPLYEEFKKAYFENEDFSSRKFTSFIKKYATLYNLVFRQPAPIHSMTYFILQAIGQQEMAHEEEGGNNHVEAPPPLNLNI